MPLCCPRSTMRHSVASTEQRDSKVGRVATYQKYREQHERSQQKKKNLNFKNGISISPEKRCPTVDTSTANLEGYPCVVGSLISHILEGHDEAR